MELKELVELGVVVEAEYAQVQDMVVVAAEEQQGQLFTEVVEAEIITATVQKVYMEGTVAMETVGRGLNLEVAELEATLGPWRELVELVNA